MADPNKSVRSFLNKILKDLRYDKPNIKIKPVSSEGANYTSVLYEITVTNQGKETLELFAKVASISDKFREELDNANIFEIEKMVYEKLAKVYEQLQEEHNIPKEERYVFSKYYGSSLDVGHETFVFENLGAKGYKIYDRFEPMDYESLFDTTAALAKYHALGFALSKNYPELFYEFEAAQHEIIKSMDVFLESSTRNIDKSIKYLDEKYQTRVQNFLDSGNGLRMIKKFYRPFGTKMLVHGDFRASNIMCKKKGDRVLVVPVDYQCVRGGCGVMDLLYLVTLGSDETFRTEHFSQLMDHYHSQLSDFLSKLKIDANKVYPKKQFLLELKEMLPASLVLALTFYPLILVDPAEAPKSSDEKMGMSDFFFDPNEKSMERLTGYVRTCIQWGII